jgi:hypothetical protein
MLYSIPETQAIMVVKALPPMESTRCQATANDDGVDSSP